MSFFFPNHKVSKQEFDEVKSSLSSKGFSREKIDEVIQIFHGDMAEAGDYEGVDAKEVTQELLWLRSNIGKHRLTEKDITVLEEVLKKRL